MGGIGILALLGAVAPGWAADWAPSQSRLEKYEHIWKSSPFIVATEVTPGAESLAQRYALTGFALVNDRDVVFVYDRKSLARFSISRESEVNGLKLVAFDRKGGLEQSSATVRSNNTEMVEIRYDAALNVGGEPQPNAQIPAGVRPGHPAAALAGRENVQVAQPPPSQVAGGGTPQQPRPVKIIRRNKPIALQ